MSDAIEGEIVNQPIEVELTKHDEVIVRKLEVAFNNMFNVTEACQYADISRETYYNWLEDDDAFSYRMSIARTAPNRKAKQNVAEALRQGDPKISLKYLTIKDPDFKPKTILEVNPTLSETRSKIKGFLEDDNDTADDVSTKPPATDGLQVGDQVAETPTDIS